MATDLPIAYAGEPGAFAEDAVIAAFGDVARTSQGSFRDVFRVVAAGDAAAGVVPIENVINGTVREVYDLLLEHDLSIEGEVVVPVRLCLAALPGQRLDEIERVYSHIQALGQSEGYLRRRPWQLLTTYNTAGAGKSIVDRAERGAAAVLSPRAAALFGLEILADEVGDAPGNRTRFIVIGRGPEAGVRPTDRPEAGVRPTDRSGRGPEADAHSGDLSVRRATSPDALAIEPLAASTTEPGATAQAPAPWRTTLAFGVRNEPGSLLRALQVFADRSVNLSRLESRPSRSRDWEYVFLTDVDGSATETHVAAALDDLRAVTSSVRVLGTYPRASD